MTINEFQNMLTAAPFRPFLIHLADGDLLLINQLEVSEKLVIA